MSIHTSIPNDSVIATRFRKKLDSWIDDPGIELDIFKVVDAPTPKGKFALCVGIFPALSHREARIATRYGLQLAQSTPPPDPSYLEEIPNWKASTDSKKWIDLLKFWRSLNSSAAFKAKVDSEETVYITIMVPDPTLNGSISREYLNCLETALLFARKWPCSSIYLIGSIDEGTKSQVNMGTTYLALMGIELDRLKVEAANGNIFDKVKAASKVLKTENYVLIAPGPDVRRNSLLLYLATSKRPILVIQSKSTNVPSLQYSETLRLISYVSDYLGVEGLKKFQKWLGIEPTGEVTQETINAICDHILYQVGD